MRTRNACLLALVAQIGAVGMVAAQKPAPKAAPVKATQQTPPVVSADSARKVLMANVAGATVKQERLHRKSQHLVYDFSYTQPSDKSTHHATVDAQNGEFKAAAASARSPGATASRAKATPDAKAAPKKPGA